MKLTPDQKKRLAAGACVAVPAALEIAAALVTDPRAKAILGILAKVVTVICDKKPVQAFQAVMELVELEDAEVKVNPLIYSAKVSPRFAERVREISEDMGTDPDWLMACMHFETGGTFAPDICSGGSRWRELPVDDRENRAVGLIQFTGVALRDLAADGFPTTKGELAAMTAVEQLTWVYRYFICQDSAITSLDDLYMAIFCPRACGKPGDFVCYHGVQGAAYRANRGLDADADGKITKDEACARVRKIYLDGGGKYPNSEVDTA